MNKRSYNLDYTHLCVLLRDIDGWNEISIGDDEIGGNPATCKPEYTKLEW